MSNYRHIETKLRIRWVNAQTVCLLVAVAILLTSLTGCGAPAGPAENVVPVSGSVRFDGEPVEGIMITFIPTGKNNAHVGNGVTDSEGQFEMINYQKKKGLPAGSYIATFSLYRMADGSAPPNDKSPVDAGAIEVIPPLWNKATRIASERIVPAAKSASGDKVGKKADAQGQTNLVNVPEDGITDLVFKIPKTQK